MIKTIDFCSSRSESCMKYLSIEREVLSLVGLRSFWEEFNL